LLAVAEFTRRFAPEAVATIDGSEFNPRDIGPAKRVVVLQPSTLFRVGQPCPERHGGRS
jgi:hypothetical protein